VEALRRDLGKPEFESYLAEVQWLMNDIVFTSRHLEKWVKDEKAPDISFPWTSTSPRIRKDPLGCVLVIGCVVVNLQTLLRMSESVTDCVSVYYSAFNYPFQLTLGPVIGAIAAGNTVAIKTQ